MSNTTKRPNERPLRIVLVEDEEMVSRRLARLLREILGTVELTLCRSLPEARRTLRDRPPDLLCLDLDLYGADGFRLLTEAVAGPQQTIVVSAHVDRALEAFEHGVLDFVPKPFGRERLARALERLRASTAPEHPVRYLGVRRSGRIDLVDIADVRFVEGADDYSQLVLRNGRTLLHEKTLTALERLLPADFERIHRSFLVRVSEIASFRALQGSRWQVVLHDDTVLPVGRTRREAVRQRLD